MKLITMNWGALLGTLLLGLSPYLAEARTIYFGSETETITLSAQGSTLFRFPAEVRTISQANRFEIRPANPDSPNYALLEVKPRFSSGQAQVIFILNDGTTIQTKLMVLAQTAPEKTDSIYEFKSKDTLLAQSGDTRAGSGLSELELMKAMIRGDEVAGYEIKRLSRQLTPGFKGVTTTLVKVYTGNQFNGYIFELKNVTKNQKLLINNQNLMLGDPSLALLSSVEPAVINSEGSTNDTAFLKIVAKPTSLYNQLILPIQMVDKKEAQ